MNYKKIMIKLGQRGKKRFNDYVRRMINRQINERDHLANSVIWKFKNEKWKNK